MPVINAVPMNNALKRFMNPPVARPAGLLTGSGLKLTMFSSGNPADPDSLDKEDFEL
jgi:hypothetical protein